MTLAERTRTGFRIGAALTALAAVLIVAGCASAPAPDPTPTEPTAAFPRTITVPAGQSTAAVTMQIPAKPTRIAALTYETAELVAALGAGEHLVMVPEAVMNPVLTNHREEMVGVESKAPTESTTNAEAVIRTRPDLVLLSARHGLEDGAGRALASAGIPVIVLPNSWATVDDMLANIALVGEALGVETEADALAAAIDSGLSEASTPTGADAPSVLVLSNQAGRPFVTAGAAFPLELVRLAGATHAEAALGLTATGPITAEQVIQAAPDAILLIDMNGSGETLFAPIMSNPAVASLPAITDGRVLLVEGRQVQALGLAEVVGGLDAITTWLY